MFQVREWKLVKTGSPASRLQFETDPGPVGLRYLLIDGKRAYNLGINCQTCSLLFERLAGANQPVGVEATAEALRAGVGDLNQEVVATVGRGLPEGNYQVLLAEAAVSLALPGDRNDYFAHEQIDLWGEDTFWCLPHDPRIPYYRAGDSDLGNKRRLFNFIVPMIPARWLSAATVEQYREARQDTGPGTAVALSVLDVRTPTLDERLPLLTEDDPEPDPIEHWCFTHYLIDGHHKLQAAAETATPLRLLSFTALNQGISTPAQVEAAVNSLLVAI